LVTRTSIRWHASLELCQRIEVLVTKILERFGHQNLNTLAEFQGSVPTTENLCVEIFDILEENFHHAQVDKVRIEETMLNSFEYAGGREIRY